MYDELIERLRECSTEVNCTGCDCNNSLMKQAADAIEDLENRLNLWRQDKIRRWIPATERLPDNQCDVLCGDEGRVAVGYYTDEEVGWHDSHSYKIYPTHWMPLPEPPKDGEP